jgi:hypothetical protein
LAEGPAGVHESGRVRQKLEPRHALFEAAREVTLLPGGETALGAGIGHRQRDAPKHLGRRFDRLA